MKRFKRITCGLLSLMLLAGAVTGCTKYESGSEKVYTYDEAVKELNAFQDQIQTDSVKPQLDIYKNEEASKTLASIDTFPLTVQGRGSINIEIAAATEMSSAAPDDWMNQVAENFNRSGATVGGKNVSVTVRKITSGEVLTYMTESDYKPDVYAPSSDAWGEMLSAKGVSVRKIADRIAGNTAGILMEKNTYDTFVEKYKEVTLKNVLEASIAGDLTFAYTNPYTSSTGLNILTAMLHAFDSSGVRFDAYGNLRPDAMPESDIQAFEARQKTAIQYYNTFTVLGSHVDGKLTLRENFADISGLQCALAIAATPEHQKTVFENYAFSWKTLAEDKDAKIQLDSDEHSPAIVRINAVVACFDEFYEIYGVKEGDPMYVAPAERVRRW